VTIASEEKFSSQVEILDIAGKLLKQAPVESGGRISLEGLNEGAYMMSVITTVVKVSTIKVVIA